MVYMYMRMLVTGISSWRPGFSPMVVHMEFKVFWSVIGADFLWALCFSPASCNSTIATCRSVIGRGVEGWYNRSWYEGTQSDCIPDRIWFLWNLTVLVFSACSYCPFLEYQLCNECFQELMEHWRWWRRWLSHHPQVHIRQVEKLH